MLMEQGTKITNYTVGVQEIPICMGNGIQCLKITFQLWLSVANTTQDFHSKFYMLYSSAFIGKEINAIDFRNLLFCEIWFTTKKSN